MKTLPLLIATSWCENRYSIIADSKLPFKGEKYPQVWAEVPCYYPDHQPIYKQVAEFLAASTKIHAALVNLVSVSPDSIQKTYAEKVLKELPIL